MIGKKGSFQDVIWIGVVILVLAMMLLIGLAIMSNVNDQIQGNTNMESHSRNASLNLKNHYLGIMDNGVLFLAIGLSIGAIGLAAFVRVHPVFLVLFIIMLVVLIFFAGIFSNIYQTAAANPALTAYADQLTFTSLVLNFLPIFVGVIGLIVMVVIYKVGRDDY